MKRFLMISFLIVALGLVTAGTGYTQPLALEFDGQRSQMKVTGSSTIHDWTCAEISLDGQVKLPELSVEKTALPLKQLTQYLNSVEPDTPGASLSIPVKSMACEKSGMDSRMHNALKFKEHPQITYEMTSVNVNKYDTEHQTLSLATEGQLTVAGKVQTISMPVTVSTTEDGYLRIKGKKALTMTQFEMERPSAMWGTIQAYDDITVHYEVYARPNLAEENQ